MRQQNNQIFSQEALDKLRSPEKLDTMLPITTPVSWMALIAVLVLLFVVVFRSIYGAFTVKDSMGLITDSTGGDGKCGNRIIKSSAKKLSTNSARPKNSTRCCR